MTTTKRDQVYITHMLECIQRIEEYVSEGQEFFIQTVMVQDAVLRVLQVMAESSQRISDQAKADCPGIDWRSISGFRNILVHDYLGGIDIELIWQVIEQELPTLKKALAKIEQS